MFIGFPIPGNPTGMDTSLMSEGIFADIGLMPIVREISQFIDKTGNTG